MKSIRLLIAACALAGVSSVFAGTINFEGAPTGVDLGSYYAGVTFAPTLQAETQILPYFPSHSGTEVLSGTDIGNPNITFTFATPQTQLSFWYVSAYGFTATAYAANGTTVVGTFSGTANENLSAVYGNPSTYSVNLETGLNTGVADISKVVITDSGGLGTFITIDDLSAPGISGLPAPDATSTLALFGVAGLCLFVFGRKVAAR
jgi:hypothetical protein